MGKRFIKILITLLIASSFITLPSITVLAIPGDFISPIDYYEYDANAALNCIIRINSTNYWASVYQNADGSNDGFIKTFETNVSGTFKGVVVDTYEFNPTNGIGPGICHILNSDYYIIGHNDNTNSIFSTIRIFEDGTVTHHRIDNVTANNSALYFNITRFHDDFYVATAQDFGADPDPIYLYSLHVNKTDGKVTINDTMTISADGAAPRIQVIDGNTIAVCYRDSGTTANVSTFTIDPSTGDIQGMVEGQSHNALTNGKVSIKRVSNTDYYILGYSYNTAGVNYKAGVGIVEIASDGTIPSPTGYGSSHNFDREIGLAFYVNVFAIQENYVYGITSGSYVFIFNVTAGSITLYGVDSGYAESTVAENAYSNQQTFHYTGTVFIDGFSDSGDDGRVNSFAIQTNYGTPIVTPYPSNNSAIPDLSTVLAAYVSDADGDTMTINWWSNITGDWILMQQNTSATNDTYYCYNYSFQHLSYDHIYYWRVDCLDWNNIHNTSAIYRFSVINMTAGYVNATEYVDLMPNITIYVNSSVGTLIDNITWYFYNDSIGVWETVGNNETAYTPGNYSHYYTNITECCHIYQWGVLLWDSATGTIANSTYWFISMCVNPPGSFNAARWNSSAINLTWSRWSNPNATGTVYTMVRYRNDTYPSSPTDGILLYNGTASSYNWTGLTEGQTYYFSAWTVYNKNTAWCTSDWYTTDALTLTGGTYNITIRYENNNSLMDPAIDYFDNLRIIFRYQNGTIIANESLSDYGSNPFSVDVNGTPDVVLITYEYWGTIRSLTPSRTTRNLTFWVSPRPYWDGNTSNYNISQLYYSFQIQDLTRNSIFASSEDTRLYIYRYYNSTVKMDIHQMYLSSGTAWAFLEYGQEYFFGIECSKEYRPILNQSFMALTNQGPITIVIYPTNDSINFIRQFVNTSVISKENNLSISYTDSSYQTTKVEIKIYKYYSENGTYYLVTNYTREGTSSFFISWTDVQGYQNNQTYYVEYNITHGFFTGIVSLPTYSFPYINPLYDADWINTMLDSVLGECPFGKWTRTFTFGISFLMLLAFASVRMGEVGLFVSGLTVFFMQVMIFDDAAIRFLAGSLGVLMCILSIIFYMGKGRQY